ncbi:hypothetical protein ACNHYB_08165 [Isoptericola jiangsuensis]|uniref:hypothetical protein n=1 Tax=Isoptericola jiangsuensis TaxID=548579 RepID=UPI003AB03691
MVEAINGLTGEVLLVSRDQTGRSVARSARLAVGGSRLAHLHVPCRATQWAVVLGMLVRLSDAAMGGSRAVAEGLLFKMRTQLVLSSVAALDRPSPSLGQHVASYWPPATFLVDLSAGTVAPFRRTLDVMHHGIVLARSSKAVVPAELVQRLPATRMEIRVPESEWNARRWLEVTSMDVSPDDVTSHVLHSGRWVRCDACGRPGLSSRCLFCEVELPGVPATAAVPATSSQGVVR